MDVTVSTRNPARDDAPGLDPSSVGESTTGRGWALAGLAAGLSTVAGGVCAALVDAVYRPDLVGDPQGVVDRLTGLVPQMIGFHVLTTCAALLLVVFGIGLHRRLRRGAPADSLAPTVAAFGVLATAVVLVLGTALDTEFIFAFTEPDLVDPANAALYNHWLGTVPAVWIFVGPSALATWVLSRRGVVPRWLGIVSLVLGSLIVLVSIAPLQYMAGAIGALWVIVTSIALARR